MTITTLPSIDNEVLRRNREMTEDYYLTEREENKTIYHIWEEGRAFKDSVTPSIWCEDYRQWIVNRLRMLLEFDPSRRVLSVGCGNAFVEEILHRDGYETTCLDLNDVAVEIARGKGLPAFAADIYEWEPEVKDWDLIYGDGVLGHLYVEGSGCQTALARLKTWLKPGSGAILISNDSGVGDDVVAVPAVRGFYHLSERFIKSQLEEAGFTLIESAVYPYERPLSGMRKRVIVSACV